MNLSRRSIIKGFPLGLFLLGRVSGAVDLPATPLANKLPSALLTGRKASDIEHHTLISRVLSWQILSFQGEICCRKYGLTIRHNSVNLLIALIRNVPELSGRDGLWEAYASSILKLREDGITNGQQLDDSDLLTLLTGRGDGDFQGIPGVDYSSAFSEGRFYTIGPKSVEYGLYAPHGEEGLALQIRGYHMPNCFSHSYSPQLKRQALPKQYPFDQGQFSKELLRFLDCAVRVFGNDFWGFTERVQQYSIHGPVAVSLQDLAVAEPLPETGSNQLIYNSSLLLSAAHELVQIT